MESKQRIDCGVFLIHNRTARIALLQFVYGLSQKISCRFLIAAVRDVMYGKGA
jgi:hypothetical protein